MVLSRYGNKWKPAMLVNSAGDQQELGCFEKAVKTDAYQSCSLTWNNKLFIFGGAYERKQISRLDGYKLNRIGSLFFDHQYGACSQMNNKYIFLCFSSKDTTTCRRSTSPLESFVKIASSTYSHRGISVSASESKFGHTKSRIKVALKNSLNFVSEILLAVGQCRQGHNKVEFYDSGTESWTDIIPYPHDMELNGNRGVANY